MSANADITAWALFVPGHISGIVLLGLLRGKGTPGIFDPEL